MNIEELKQEEKRLRNLLAENIEAQRKINAAEFQKKTGFSVGDIIEYGKDNKAVAKIVGIEFHGSEAYRFQVSIIKKNGEFSDVLRTLWYSDLQTATLVEKADS